jgi:hypothetical protein
VALHVVVRDFRAAWIPKILGSPVGWSLADIDDAGAYTPLDWDAGLTLQAQRFRRRCR